MGCGSSSLKGEKVDVGGDGAGPPARKVNTNFGEVDFSGGAAPDRRSTMAVAPDEHGRTSGAHGTTGDVAPDMPTTPSKSKGANNDGAALEPYHTIEEPAAGADQVVKKKEDHLVEDLSPTSGARAAEPVDNLVR